MDDIEKLLHEYTFTVKTPLPHERHLEVSYSPAGKRDFPVPDRSHPIAGWPHPPKCLYH